MGHMNVTTWAVWADRCDYMDGAVLTLCGLVIVAEVHLMYARVGGFVLEGNGPILVLYDAVTYTGWHLATVCCK